jgi:subtilisin family serine protease
MTITESRLRRTTFAAIAAVAALAFGAAAPASAATNDGLWYFDALHIGDHHAAGITGEGVTIAVLDGPVNTDIPTLKNANVEVRKGSFCYTEDGKVAPATSTDLSGPDSAYHATNVVSYIAGTGDGYPGQQGVKGVAPGAKVLVYAISRLDSVVDGGEKLSCLEKDGQDLSTYEVGLAMYEAMDAGADIIVIPAGYTGTALAADEGAYSRAIREGVIVVGSVANTDDLAVSLGFPAGANGSVGVQAADINGQIQATEGRPNDNGDTMVVAPGIGILTQGERDGDWKSQPITQGTSLAAPIETGYIALAMQKWPAASGNQILQDLVRSSNDQGEPFFDETRMTGFGFATATRMLDRDASQYEDVNPLLDARPDNQPSTEELLAAPTAEPEPEPTSDPVAAPDWGPVIVLLLSILGGGIVLVVIVLVVVFAIRRSRRKTPSGTTPHSRRLGLGRCGRR